MVVHSLLVGKHTDTYKSEIRITKEENDVCIVIDGFDNLTAEAYLSLEELHDFIGTLLHVQQKLKNQ